MLFTFVEQNFTVVCTGYATAGHFDRTQTVLPHKGSQTTEAAIISRANHIECVCAFCMLGFDCLVAFFFFCAAATKAYLISMIFSVTNMSAMENEKES